MIFSKYKRAMKKHLLFILIAAFTALSVNAQTRGMRIGYIDMEYILEKVPDYAEAKNQLELKAQKWKQEIEVKKNEIQKQKESLKVERVLLTKELIEEREEEIAFLENELVQYQEKRFGPRGDLITQKSVLVKPIQDQVFNAVQDISEKKKFDFVFDKASDLTIMFAAQRHDISDQVIRMITRSAKREQLSKKQLKELDAQEALEDAIDENPALAERQKRLEERKAQRDSIAAERKAMQEAKKLEAQERREKLKQERENKKAGNISPQKNTSDTTPGNIEAERPGTATEEEPETTGTKPPTAEERRKAAQEERERKIQERKDAAEERRQKIIADREAAKKAREEQKNDTKEEDNKKEN